MKPATMATMVETRAQMTTISTLTPREVQRPDYLSGDRVGTNLSRSPRHIRVILLRPTDVGAHWGWPGQSPR